MAFGSWINYIFPLSDSKFTNNLLENRIIKENCTLVDSSYIVNSLLSQIQVEAMCNWWIGCCRSSVNVLFGLTKTIFNGKIFSMKNHFPRENTIINLPLLGWSGEKLNTKGQTKILVEDGWDKRKLRKREGNVHSYIKMEMLSILGKTIFHPSQNLF